MVIITSKVVVRDEIRFWGVMLRCTPERYRLITSRTGSTWAVDCSAIWGWYNSSIWLWIWPCQMPFVLKSLHAFFTFLCVRIGAVWQRWSLAVAVNTSVLRRMHQPLQHYIYRNLNNIEYLNLCHSSQQVPVLMLLARQISTFSARNDPMHSKNKTPVLGMLYPFWVWN